MERDEAVKLIKELKLNIKNNFKIEDDLLNLVLSAWLSGGHILLNDKISTGKTTLSKILSSLVNAKFKRIQFTSDITPSDISGINTFDPNSGKWIFHPGPIFANIVLADEINRAPPKNHSSLLEAMAEKQITLDGITHKLEEVFIVIATKNPLEHLGTFELTEALEDRFSISLSLGDINEDEELDIILGKYKLSKIEPVMDMNKFLELRKFIENIHVHEDVGLYGVRLIRNTRLIDDLLSGASIRSGIALIECAKALSLIKDDSKVTPDHIHSLVIPVLSHRLKIKEESEFRGVTVEKVLKDLLEETPPY